MRASAPDKLIGVIGGDHSAAIGSALSCTWINHPQLSVLYIDAHADLRDEYQGTAWGHGSSARRISLNVAPSRLVGVRTLGAWRNSHFINECRLCPCATGLRKPPITCMT